MSKNEAVRSFAIWYALAAMNTLLDQIKTVRAAIRYHRDQKGDDRCWVDDERLWALLPDAPPEPRALPSFEDMMKKCGAFYHLRRADVPDPIPAQAQHDPLQWDADLETMSEADAEQELSRLHEAARRHRSIQDRDLTIEDDRQLYRVLPEQLTADFRLPPEPDFLGEANAPAAGCPSFWRSHQHCPNSTHDIHVWGPCT